MIAGLGKKKEFNLEKLRGVFSKACQKIRDLNITQMAASLDLGDAEFSIRETAQAAVEGAMLGLYRFTPYKTLEEDKGGELSEFTIVESRAGLLEDVKDGAKNSGDYLPGSLLCERSRLHTIQRYDTLNPGGQGQRCREAGKPQIRGIGRNHNEKTGHECTARRIERQRRGGKTDNTGIQWGQKNDKPIVLVGKGVTFDSGGNLP